MASRATQPYRRGPREQTSPLKAMLKGAPAHLPNPQDQKRELQKRGGRRTIARSAFLDDLADSRR